MNGAPNPPQRAPPLPAHRPTHLRTYRPPLPPPLDLIAYLSIFLTTKATTVISVFFAPPPSGHLSALSRMSDGELLNTPLAQYDTLAVGKLFKDTLAKNEPLFPYDSYDDLLAIQRASSADPDKASHLHDLVSRLDSAHRQVLGDVFRMFGAIEANRLLTQVSSDKLSYAFGPSLIRPRFDSGDLMQVARDAKSINELTRFLIDHREEVFQAGSPKGSPSSSPTIKASAAFHSPPASPLPKEVSAVPPPPPPTTSAFASTAPLYTPHPPSSPPPPVIHVAHPPASPPPPGHGRKASATSSPPPPPPPSMNRPPSLSSPLPPPVTRPSSLPRPTFSPSPPSSPAPMPPPPPASSFVPAAPPPPPSPFFSSPSAPPAPPAPPAPGPPSAPAHAYANKPSGAKFTAAATAGGGGRGALLGDIASFKGGLRKSATVDKSAPAIDRKEERGSSGTAGGAGPVEPAPQLGGLFAGGMPKLRKTSVGAKEGVAKEETGRGSVGRRDSGGSGPPPPPVPSAASPSPPPPPFAARPGAPRPTPPSVSAGGPPPPPAPAVTRTFATTAPSPPPPPPMSASSTSSAPPPPPLAARPFSVSAPPPAPGPPPAPAFTSSAAPPPPPGPPAPPGAPSAPVAPSGMFASKGKVAVKAGGGGRGALLGDIASFGKGGLKKTQTVDKSAPVIEGGKTAPGSGGGVRAGGGGGGSVPPPRVSMGGGGAGGGAMSMQDEMAARMAKMRASRG